MPLPFRHGEMSRGKRQAGNTCVGLGVVEYFGKRVLARKSWGIRGEGSKGKEKDLKGFFFQKALI